MFKKVLIVVCVFACAVAEITDCGSQLATVTKVQISDCKPDDNKCILKRGTNASMELTFTMNEDTDGLNAVVHGVIAGLPVPFHLPNENACENSGLVCPLKSGNSYTYTAELPVLQKYPKLTVDVKWELVRTDSKVATCTLIPSKLT